MLFNKECKKVLLSLTFWIYCILVVIMFAENYYSEAKYPISKPAKGGSDYGLMVREDPELIMEGASASLMSDFASNRYVCYPYGFYKAVSLDKEDRDKVEEYVTEITAWDHDEILKQIDSADVYYMEHGFSTFPGYEFESVNIDKNMTYERYKEIMADIDDILGGGSAYKVDTLASRYSLVPMTYEDAVKEYEDSISEDTVTGSLARLFSDYAGISLAYTPVFAAAALVAADRRRKMTELVYSRNISSLKLTFIRYGALVAMMFIPVFLTMIAAAIQAGEVYGDEPLKMHYMFTTTTFWLLPELMAVTAVGMFLTEFFSAGFAVAAQGAWSFLSLMSCGDKLSGNITKFCLICRHNTLYDRSAFMETYNDFVFNRIFYMVLALVMVLAAAYVYHLKRGGRFNGIRLFGKGSLFRRKA